MLLHLCSPDSGPVGEVLQRPRFGMYRTRWPEEEGVEYNLAHGDWLRLLRGNSFEVLDLIELQAHPGATPHGYYDFVSVEWARRWPAEEIWFARLVD